MNIGLVDIIIFLFILLGGIAGFKEGAIKKTTSIVGLILVVVFSFILKNKLSYLFYENLPFIELWGAFKGIQVLNIIFYELLAFIIIASVLTIVYRLLLSLTGLIENVLKATIILSIPSKIIGFILGLIESYIWVYLFLVLLTIPFISSKINNISKEIYSSETATFILDKTIVLSKYTEKTVRVYKDIYSIIDNKENNEKVNEEAMDLFLKYDIITVESADKLIKKNKVTVNDDSFIDKYR